MKKSEAEATLALQLRALGYRGWQSEFRFHGSRKWRFDFANPGLMLAIEVEGVTHYGKNADGSMKLGRHQTGQGMEKDLEKYDEGLRLGWVIYRCSPAMVKSGHAIETIGILLEMRK